MFGLSCSCRSSLELPGLREERTSDLRAESVCLGERQLSSILGSARLIYRFLFLFLGDFPFVGEMKVPPRDVAERIERLCWLSSRFISGFTLVSHPCNSLLLESFCNFGSIRDAGSSYSDLLDSSLPLWCSGDDFPVRTPELGFSEELDGTRGMTAPAAPPIRWDWKVFTSFSSCSRYSLTS